MEAKGDGNEPDERVMIEEVHTLLSPMDPKGDGDLMEPEGNGDGDNEEGED
nr:hypothetical protein Iba_chr11eCG12600 [Ipomoea batatas]